MKLKGILIIIIAFSLVPETGYGQSEELNYSKEIAWGITKATNSGLIGGFIFKYSFLHRNKAFHYIGAEIVNVKHPKEERYYSFTGNTYIYGKSNYLYSLRGYFGRDWLLFKKAPQQGVQINGMVGIGPSIGIVAPYYIEYLRSDGSVIKEQYDPNIHDNRENILGTGSLFQGLGDSEITMGLNSKAAIAFEFGASKFNVVGLEVGFMVEVFSREIPIIPTAENYSLIPNSYVTLYYGSRR